MAQYMEKLALYLKSEAEMQNVIIIARILLHYHLLRGIIGKNISNLLTTLFKKKLVVFVSAIVRYHKN